MAAPDPYPAGTPSPVADEEMATIDTPDEDVEAEEEETDETPETKRHHLYLPKAFPSDVKPQIREKKKFIVEAEYVDTEDGEQCWKELSIDGVPVSEAAAKDQEEVEDEMPDADAATGEDPAQMPEVASKNPVTQAILGG